MLIKMRPHEVSHICFVNMSVCNTDVVPKNSDVLVSTYAEMLTSQPLVSMSYTERSRTMRWLIFLADEQ
jgi:hypothetical protein